MKVYTVKPPLYDCRPLESIAPLATEECLHHLCRLCVCAWTGLGSKYTYSFVPLLPITVATTLHIITNLIHPIYIPLPPCKRGPGLTGGIYVRLLMWGSCKATRCKNTWLTWEYLLEHSSVFQLFPSSVVLLAIISSQQCSLVLKLILGEYMFVWTCTHTHMHMRTPHISPRITKTVEASWRTTNVSGHTYAD